MGITKFGKNRADDSFSFTKKAPSSDLDCKASTGLSEYRICTSNAEIELDWFAILQHIVTEEAASYDCRYQQ